LRLYTNDNESGTKEVNSMPTLRHLLEELGILGVDPDKVRIPGQTYDNIMADAEESDEEED